jgi:alginate O-acetyltransferase complex protein AlgJ
MKKLYAVILSAVAAIPAFAADVSAVAGELAVKVTPNTITYKAENGWLYSKNELLHLAKGELANGQVTKKSACSKQKNTDPIPALKFFNDELAKRGIKLIVVPVPPKIAVEPCAPFKRGEAMAYLRPFYRELQAQGIEVLDLSETYLSDPKEHFYCRTDAHWNPAGIGAAAKELAKIIPLRGKEEFALAGPMLTVSGDLAKSLDPKNPEQENIAFTVVGSKTIDESSPVLLIGDSHTLVFSTGGDMLAEGGGLAERLALLLKMPVDRIGVKGSAATAVRINLYRKAVKKPAWLKNKKFVVYCFSCREFTESTSGWGKVPVAKK